MLLDQTLGLIGSVFCSNGRRRLLQADRPSNASNRATTRLRSQSRSRKDGTGSSNGNDMHPSPYESIPPFMMQSGAQQARESIMRSPAVGTSPSVPGFNTGLHRSEMI